MPVLLQLVTTWGHSLIGEVQEDLMLSPAWGFIVKNDVYYMWMYVAVV